MLRIGSNTNEVRIDGHLKKLESDLDAFVLFGLTAAEVTVHGTDVIRNGSLDAKRMDEIKRILQNFPLAYSVHAPNPINLMDREDPVHLAALRSTLEFSREIGAEAVVYHPGRFQAEESFGPLGKIVLPDDQKQSLLGFEVEQLQALADSFPDQVIALENARPYRHHSPYCYAERIDLLKEQVERIDRHNVGITLDFGHLNMSANFYGFNQLEAVRSIAGLIRHCHVHDNFGGAVYHTEKIQTHQIPLGKGDAHMPIGWGNIDFAGLFAPFLHDYEGLLIVELRSRYFEFTSEAASNLEIIASNLKAA
ncbi:MAG: sugar phosphate isomerase/epimerase [Desulfuromonadales bacterium]|jgi:sugar phosphate isomerase/epimerase